MGAPSAGGSEGEAREQIPLPYLRSRWWREWGSWRCWQCGPPCRAHNNLCRRSSFGGKERKEIKPQKNMKGERFPFPPPIREIICDYSLWWFSSSITTKGTAWFGDWGQVGAERGKRGGEGKWVVESTLWSVDYSIISADNKSQETRVASGGGWCVRNSTTGGNNERNY